MEVQEQNDELGPIDVVVISFPPGAPMSGEAVPMLLDLVERRTIRVLDAMFVSKDEDGRVAGFEAKELAAKGVGDFEAFEGASSGLLGDNDIATAGEALDPGGAAVLILYENRWAAPFVAAVRRNGGEPVAFERIPAQDVIEALEAAEAAA